MRILKIPVLTNLVLDVVVSSGSSSKWLRHCAEEHISTYDSPDIGETVREIDAMELSPVQSLIFCDGLMSLPWISGDRSKFVMELKKNLFTSDKSEDTRLDSHDEFRQQITDLHALVKRTSIHLIGPTLFDLGLLTNAIADKENRDKIYGILNKMWRNILFDLFLKRSFFLFRRIYSDQTRQSLPVDSQARTLEAIERKLEEQYSKVHEITGHFMRYSTESGFDEFIKLASMQGNDLKGVLALWAATHPFHRVDVPNTICENIPREDPPRLSRGGIVWLEFESLDATPNLTQEERETLCYWVGKSRNLGSDYDSEEWDEVKRGLEDLNALIELKKSTHNIYELCNTHFTRLLSLDIVRILERLAPSETICQYIEAWNSYRITKEGELLASVQKAVRLAALRPGNPHLDLDFFTGV
jgi:hypothetical protein